MLFLSEKEFCKKNLNKKLVQYNKGSSSKHVKEVPTKESIWVKKKKEVKNQILEDCSLKELISTLQKFASDSSIDVNQAGFGSYIANHVLKEKIARYNQESMIPPKLGDVWIPKVLVTIGKETHHALLDLGSSVSILSKNLYDVLELKNIEKCSTTLILADDTAIHSLGKK